MIVYTVIVMQAVTAATAPVVMPNIDWWCPEREVNFTCVVEGAQALAWMSNEYIGSGGDQLAFSVSHRIGDIRMNGNIDGTYAVLVRTEEILVSILHLYVQFNGTVTCMIIDPPGLMTNVTISIRGK